MENIEVYADELADLEKLVELREAHGWKRVGEPQQAFSRDPEDERGIALLISYCQVMRKPPNPEFAS